MVPLKRLLKRERDSSRRNSPKLAGISPEKLLAERSRWRREGRWRGSEAGMTPEMIFCERSRWRRVAQAANAAVERVALRLLLEREREDREGRRQSAAAGTGPES